MKTKLIFAAMTAIAMLSCRKEIPSASPSLLSEKVQLTINVDVPQTRVTTADTPEESKVNDIQILVFRLDGALDAYKRESSSPISGISCTAGQRNIYAVVNFPTDLCSVKTENELRGKTFAFYDEKLNGFQMIGKTTHNVSASNATVQISVQRAVAKIHFNGIKTDFQDKAYKKMPFKVTKIYAINITEKYQVTYPSTVMAPAINKAKLNTGLAANAKTLLLYQPASPMAVTNGAAPISVDRSFYVYPNYSTIEYNKTRIVVEATLGSKTYYYPLTFADKIKANTLYDIKNLIIKRPGSDNPNIPVITGDCGFKVNVIDWTTGETLNITI